MPAGACRQARPMLAALVVLLLAPLMVACESRVAAQSSDPEELELEPEPFVYVALGDSYTAAHGVPGTNWLDGCLQSDRNYPNLVGRRANADGTGGRTRGESGGRHRR